MAEGADPLRAALEAGATRIRPVLMTALAMIIGMIPMALGIGEGAEQNAPLGRAVIGGLLFATVSTLFFVPVVYAAVHRALRAAQGARIARRPSRTARIRRSEQMSERTNPAAVDARSRAPIAGVAAPAGRAPRARSSPRSSSCCSRSARAAR